MSERLWDETREDQSIPVLEFPISEKTLVLEAVGTRDFMPYHHNREFTKSKGIRDAFVNSMFFQGLIGRFVGEWAGPRAVMRSMSLQMLNQICPGDTATVRGTVVRRWRDTDDALVEIQVAVDNHLGTGATSTVIVALPSTSGGDPAPNSLEGFEAGLAEEGVPETALAELGKKVRVGTPFAVSEQQIALFCEMVRDPNPLYQDRAAAASSINGEIVAPPYSLLIWSMPRPSQTGVDSDHPDVDLPSQEPWPHRVATEAFNFKVQGTTDVIATDILIECGAPIRVGDELYLESQLAHCSPQKLTKLGPGHFVTNVQEFFNQRDELVGRARVTVLQYEGR